MQKRTADIERATKETKIKMKLGIDGKGKTKISTGIGILDHMLDLFSFHGMFDLEIEAKGDLKIDIHHTNEDIGIVLGQAFKKALGDKVGIKRFGSASIPMEDVTASVALDISGRGSYKLSITPLDREKMLSSEGYELQYAEHFFESFAKQLGMNLNIKIENANSDIHTTLEPVFKALGIALDQATQIDPRRRGIPSTKGVID